MIRLYNSLTRKKEPFRPIKNKRVGIYTCGPTVYWYQHIGNLRSYIFADILKRTFLYNGYKVKHVVNVTDVGHLTSDEDEGEDKIEKAAQKEHRTAKEISKYYWRAFRDDFKKLNILEPDIWSWATDNIEKQIDLIRRLEKKGFTYKTNDGIYFDTSKFKNYGQLARLKKTGLKPGERTEMREKKNITDFALWKFSEKPGQRQQEWQSPWGLGFPGWHIECSAMSMKCLGDSFDIHTGGEDHIPVHHTNEIAQSEAATGKKFVNVWMHGAFLTFKGEKISKSKGGLYTISELEEEKFPPLAYRYLCLTSHYRTPLDFSIKSLTGAKNSYLRLKNSIKELDGDGEINKKYIGQFKKFINDDLSMPRALAVLWALLKDKKAKGKIKAVAEMDRILGLDLLKKEKVSLPDTVKDLAEKREVFRKKNDWQRADEIRKMIEKLGYKIEDTSQGPKIKNIK